MRLLLPEPGKKQPPEPNQEPPEPSAPASPLEDSWLPWGSHGNYWGSGRTSGRDAPNDDYDGSAPPLDATDEIAMRHDYDLKYGNAEDADLRFA